MNSPDASALTTDNKRLTAGKALSERREKLGLTVEECSEALKISTSKMKALEADNDVPFPSDIFLRGYLKNYAKLVDLPVNDILYYFDSQRQTQSESIDSSAGRDLNDKRRKGNGLSCLIAVVIIVAWFLLSNYADITRYWNNESLVSQEQLSEIDVSSIVESAPVIDAGAGSSLSSVSGIYKIKSMVSESAIHEDDQSILSNSEDVSVVDETNVLEAGFHSQVSEINVDSDLSEEAVNVLDNQTSVEQVISQAEAILSTASNEIYADTLINKNFEAVEFDEPQLSVEPSLINGLLYFTFLEPCWVEVIDATNKTIVSSIRKANTELLVEGRSPFSIILGNVDGTTLRFNDEAVTLINNSDGRTLRLTVGG
ncbi:MAG: cytoskeleton protein RodZ [Granulosicoccus sp.]|jgi:cytoskeleton protein RodZ